VQVLFLFINLDPFPLLHFLFVIFISLDHLYQWRPVKQKSRGCLVKTNILDLNQPLDPTTMFLVTTKSRGRLP